MDEQIDWSGAPYMRFSLIRGAIDTPCLLLGPQSVKVELCDLVFYGQKARGGVLNGVLWVVIDADY